MKRDMDLVRTIMFVIENHEDGSTEWLDFYRILDKRFPDLDVSDNQVIEHLILMQEVGLVKLNLAEEWGGNWKAGGFSTARLTWAGHDFLADARNDRVWEEAKKQAGDVSLKVLKEVLSQTVRQFIGLS